MVRPLNRRDWCYLALAGILGLSVGLWASRAEAHTAPTVTRDCDSVTLHNSGSDGILSITAQTGSVFTVGQTIAPGGSVTKPAAPNQSGTVHVTYSTDHRDFQASWGTQPGCTPPTPPTTKPTIPPTTVPETTTTKPATTTSTPSVSLIPPVSITRPAEPVAVTPAFTG